MNPLVSILIPAFNAERWVAESIQSALDQTWQDKEIIVVDDGSSDQTFEIARRFSSRVVKVVTQANQGAAVARNKAFSLCQGDYVQWLDADDLLARDKIARQINVVKNIDNRRTLLSSAWGHFIYRRDKVKFTPTLLWNDLSPVEWLLRNLQEGIFLQPGCWLVSRELSEAAGPWDSRLSLDDDGEYFSRVVRASDSVRFVPSAAVLYRRSGFQSLGNIDQSEKKLASLHLSMQLQVANLLSLENSERTRTACLAFLQRYMLYFYPDRADIVGHLENLAGDLGGTVKVPRLSWKYAWIKRLLGWNAAKRAERYYNQCKSSVVSTCDKILFQFGLGGV